MTTVRAATTADAPGWAEVVAARSPFLVQDARSTAFEIANDPPDARRAVAEEQGRVIAVARFRAYPGEDQVSVLVMVHPDHRRRGVGSALMSWHQTHIDAAGRSTMRSIVEDDDASRAAARAWGFDLTRRLQMVALDPRRVAATEPPPADATLVPLADVEPAHAWAALNAVVGDDPSGLSHEMPWETFLAEWTHPLRRHDLGRAVMSGGEVAAFSVLSAAGGRAWSDMTGTRPAHRGHGLALLAKREAIRAAARDGVTLALAGNDVDNAPMVAINDRLGYHLFASPSVGVRRHRLGD